MSESVDEPEYGNRPWHGAENPWEALWLALDARLKALEAPKGKRAVAVIEDAPT